MFGGPTGNRTLEGEKRRVGEGKMDLLSPDHRARFMLRPTDTKINTRFAEGLRAMNKKIVTLFSNLL